MHLLAANLPDYGLPETNQFLTAIKNQQSSLWLDDFDSRTLSVVKFDHNDDVLPHEGLTLEGLKLIEMLATFT
jgi:trehalose-6-phosphatase